MGFRGVRWFLCLLFLKHWEQTSIFIKASLPMSIPSKVMRSIFCEKICIPFTITCNTRVRRYRKGTAVIMKFIKKIQNITSVDNEKNTYSSMELTTENIKKILSDSPDVQYQVHYINGCRNLPVTVIYIAGLVNKKIINDDILKPLVQEKVLSEANNFPDIINLIEKGIIYNAARKVNTKLDDTINDIINGSLALVFDKEKKAITFEVKEFEKRSITEPTNENVLKGSKDSFIEVLTVNRALVRRKLRTPNLRIKEIIVGTQTKTPINVIYIENITNQEIVDEVMKRLAEINVDGAIVAGSIEEYIIDNKRTVFPQVAITERTDKFCQHILEGKVGMIIDGLPIAYVIPVDTAMFYKAPEDYAQNYITSSFIRCLRYISSLITLFLPGFYISITTFHQEMIPTSLAESIIESKGDVPFPTNTSVLMLLIAFELLLEAGLRLPRTIGQAISIIGALVVGQAAVQAKLISPAVVIVVAVTGITGFTMPNQDYANALRILRFIFVISASIAGLYGVSLAFVALLYHINSLETFGVPYLSPFVANEGREMLQDTLIRIPLYKIKKRPSSFKPINKKRQE